MNYISYGLLIVLVIGMIGVIIKDCKELNCKEFAMHSDFMIQLTYQVLNKIAILTREKFIKMYECFDKKGMVTFVLNLITDKTGKKPVIQISITIDYDIFIERYMIILKELVYYNIDKEIKRFFKYEAYDNKNNHYNLNCILKTNEILNEILSEDKLDFKVISMASSTINANIYLNKGE